MPSQEQYSTSDVLVLSDYRRLVHVLDDLVGEAEPAAFRSRLPASLARCFHWPQSAVHDGPVWTPRSEPGPVAAALGHRGLAAVVNCPHPAHAAHGLFTVRARTSTERRFCTAVRGLTIVAKVGEHGTRAIYLSVSFPKGRAGRREVAILCRLSRLAAEARPISPERARPSSLTPRENEASALVAVGLTNDQIADRLCVTVDTIKKHLTSAMAKMDCASRTQLAIRWRDDTSSRQC